MASSNSGTWYDTKAGKVVTSQPEEGVQLVAPGVEPTADEKSRVEAYKSGANADTTVDATVTTKTGSK
jgi:hypothetical protein